MTTIPTTLLIIGSIIFFMLGGFVGVIVMAVIAVGHESEEEADRIDAEMTAAEIAELYDEQEGETDDTLS